MKKLSLLEKILIGVLILECIFLFKFKLIVGSGDSMLPTLKNPSLLLCMRQDKFSVGDIVFYKIDGMHVVHRVYRVKEYFMSDDTVVRTYILKGDNNPQEDSFEVYRENIECKVLFHK